MKLVSRYKAEIILGLVIILIYSILRLPNLTLQPIFADEAIYIRWAQVMKAEPTLRFLPLTDGKTPLFMWTLMPFLKFFDDPLLAGRFLSVMSGFVTLAGVYFLGRRAFGPKVGLWAALIYAISPYTVFFDRMALVDSMLSAFSIWSLYLTLWLLKAQRLDLAMILGYLLGGGILVKTPAMLNLLILPFSLIGFNFGRTSSLLKLLSCWAVAIIIAMVIYNLLRLGPEFQQLSSRNADYVFSPVELINRPLDPFVPHLKDISNWFPILLTWPILFFGTLGIFGVVKERTKLGLVILLWALIPLILQMVFLKTFTARYLLFSIPPLLVLAGYGMELLLRSIKIITASPKPRTDTRGMKAKLDYILPRSMSSEADVNLELTKPRTFSPWKFINFVKVIIVILLISAQPFYFNYLLLTDPQKAPLPKVERRGYFEDWTAGYGFSEIAKYLLEQKKQGPVVVGTEGYFGTLPDGLHIYLNKADIPIIGSSASISAQLRQATEENQVFFVANNSRVRGSLKGVTLIKEFPKARADNNFQDAILLFKVLPNE